MSKNHGINGLDLVLPFIRFTLIILEVAGEVRIFIQVFWFQTLIMIVTHKFFYTFFLLLLLLFFLNSLVYVRIVIYLLDYLLIFVLFCLITYHLFLNNIIIYNTNSLKTLFDLLTKFNFKFRAILKSILYQIKKEEKISYLINIKNQTLTLFYV